MAMKRRGNNKFMQLSAEFNYSMDYSDNKKFQSFKQKTKPSRIPDDQSEQSTKITFESYIQAIFYEKHYYFTIKF